MRILILCLVFVMQSAQAAHDYDTYRNSRLSYAISYPKDILYPQGEADNGDGQSFLSINADVKLSVFGSNNALSQTLGDVYRDELYRIRTSEPIGVITYKLLKDDYFVVSGVRSGVVFYNKVILRNDQFKEFIFTYPLKDKKIYDTITKHISSSFEG